MDDPVIKYHNTKEDYHNYPKAPFIKRALAFFIDAVILGFFQTGFTAFYDYALGFDINIEFTENIYNLIYLLCNAVLIPSLYFIPQVKRNGQTVGKKVMKIKIIREDYSEDLGVIRIFLREIIGKFISAFFFGAGYIVAFFGIDTFHDKIAGTRVISLNL